MCALSRNNFNKANLRRVALALPFLISFFYLFIRNLSVSSMYIACLLGLGLTLFSKASPAKNIVGHFSWNKIITLIILVFSASFAFYYFAGLSLSYFESPYSIVLTMLPFFIFFRMLDKEESSIYILIMLFIGSGILSYWLGEQSAYGNRIVSSRYFKLLYIAPLLIVFKWMQLDWKTYIAVVTAGIAGLLLTLLITYYYFEYANGGVIDRFMYQGPVSGNTNPIFFGLIALCLTMPIYLAIFFGIVNKKNILILTIILSVGVASVLACGSRGVWVALFSVLFIYIFYIIFNKEIEKLSKLVSIVTVVLIGVVFFNSQLFEDRIALAIKDVESFNSGVNTRETHIENSLGTRFELWRAALKMFHKHSVFGVGPGAFSNELSKLADKNELNPEFVIYNQAHNQYFHTLATKGFVGIIMLVALFIVLLWMPLKRIFGFTFVNRQTKYLACCAVSVLLAYAVLGLTESPFERRSVIVFFTFFYSLSIAAMKNSEKHNN